MIRVHAIAAPWREPAEVLAAFADEPFAVGLLGGDTSPRGRWTYLARAPDAAGTIARATPDAAAELRRLLPSEPVQPLPDVPFSGGLIGLAAYSLGEAAEPLGLPRRPGWPDLAWGRYGALLAFDHEMRTLRAIGRAGTAREAEHNAAEALAWLSQPAPPPHAGPLAEDLHADDPAAYEAAVAEVVARIAAGEFFQANIARSWRWRLAPGARPFDLAARLAAASPAPFAAYLAFADRALVSNSPERFVAVRPCPDGGPDNGFVAETRPIKGTLPRLADPAEDSAQGERLAASAKDRAENLMIVDLMRNDLARVSTPGQVRVPRLFEVESFANVHHLVSQVTARLAPGQRALDLLVSAFPPGSITGAPKVQAMKTIAALESPRGPFFGSVFWAGADGAFDSSVLIRTAAFERDTAGGWTGEFRAGAGIVADSDPRAERLETEAKASAVLAALVAISLPPSGAWGKWIGAAGAETKGAPAWR